MVKMESTEPKRPCENCGDLFEESDLDLVNNVWLCSGCEELLKIASGKEVEADDDADAAISDDLNLDINEGD